MSSNDEDLYQEIITIETKEETFVTETVISPTKDDLQFAIKGNSSNESTSFDPCIDLYKHELESEDLPVKSICLRELIMSVVDSMEDYLNNQEVPFEVISEKINGYETFSGDKLVQREERMKNGIDSAFFDVVKIEGLLDGIENRSNAHKVQSLRSLLTRMKRAIEEISMLSHRVGATEKEVIIARDLWLLVRSLREFEEHAKEQELKRNVNKPSVYDEIKSKLPQFPTDQLNLITSMESIRKCPENGHHFNGGKDFSMKQTPENVPYFTGGSESCIKHAPENVSHFIGGKDSCIKQTPENVPHFIGGKDSCIKSTPESDHFIGGKDCCIKQNQKSDPHLIGGKNSCIKQTPQSDTHFIGGKDSCIKQTPESDTPFTGGNDSTTHEEVYFSDNTNTSISDKRLDISGGTSKLSVVAGKSRNVSSSDRRVDIKRGTSKILDNTGKSDLKNRKRKRSEERNTTTRTEDENKKMLHTRHGYQEKQKEILNKNISNVSLNSNSVKNSLTKIVGGGGADRGRNADNDDNGRKVNDSQIQDFAPTHASSATPNLQRAMLIAIVRSCLSKVRHLCSEHLLHSTFLIFFLIFLVVLIFGRSIWCIPFPFLCDSITVYQPRERSLYFGLRHNGLPPV